MMGMQASSKRAKEQHISSKEKVRTEDIANWVGSGLGSAPKLDGLYHIHLEYRNINQQVLDINTI